MKVIIATEQVFNLYGDLIGVKYYYGDGDFRKIKIFISRGRFR